jgi:hypothetical protein
MTGYRYETANVQEAAHIGRLNAMVTLPVRVALRREVGFRILGLPSIFGAAAAMFGIQFLANLLSSLAHGRSASGSDVSLYCYALGFVCLAMMERVKQKRELARGGGEHTRLHGYSRFEEFMPLPAKYVRCAIDPFVALLAGALLYHRLGLGLLGAFVMISAVAFCAVECTTEKAAATHRLDLHDSIREAEVDAGTMAGRREEPAERSAAESVATGMDEDLAREIAKRKRELADAGKRGVQHDVA